LLLNKFSFFLALLQYLLQVTHEKYSMSVGAGAAITTAPINPAPVSSVQKMKKIDSNSDLDIDF
jgi:hypothetical protein